LNPIIFVYDALGIREPIRPLAFLIHVGGLILAGAVCVVFAARWLRPMSSRRVDQPPGRWLIALPRSPIGDAPIRWRERHVIGLAPLPWLRIIPGWLAHLGVFGFSLILAGESVWSPLWDAIQPALRQANLTYSYLLIRQIRPHLIDEDVHIMGFIL